MCDTILAPPISTAGHGMLFGKNSDRHRNEAQAVERYAGGDHAADERVKCTYLTIPQARRTHTAMLCRPFWMWGAEMGANEHGVVIGNEGLHARCAAPVEEALTGMDLVRLSLERAGSAAEAVQVLTSLLGEYGQGGNCGHLTQSFYNNGFLIADPREAYVVETIGKEWLAERVSRVRSLSNLYSIGTEVMSCSAGLRALVRESGWSDEESPNYAAAITNPHREHIGHAGARRARSTALLQSGEGQLGVADMMRILRDHGPVDATDWHPEHAPHISICMHAGIESRIGQTAGSLVSELHESHAVHWVTATAAACTSIFKPVLLDAELPHAGPPLTGQFDPRVLWWRHERLHRAALSGDFAKFLHDIRPERDALEASFRARVADVLQGGAAADRSQVVASCWKEAAEMEDRWLARLPTGARRADSPYNAAWSQLSQVAGIEPALP